MQVRILLVAEKDYMMRGFLIMLECTLQDVDAGFVTKTSCFYLVCFYSCFFLNHFFLGREAAGHYFGGVRSVAGGT